MKVEIYGKELCPNCDTALSLTVKANHEVEVLKVDKDYKIPELFKRIGSPVREFPQIFVDDKYVGGLKEYKTFLKETSTDDDHDVSFESFEL